MYTLSMCPLPFHPDPPEKEKEPIDTEMASRDGLLLLFVAVANPRISNKQCTVHGGRLVC